MRVSEISKCLNVSADTVRYYTRIGLVTPLKSVNGYKDFSDKDYRKLRFAIRAKALDFSLADIKALLEVSEHGDTPFPVAREVIAKNMTALSQSIEESLALFERMKAAMAVWDGMPDRSSDGETICALIENWRDPPDTMQVES